MGCCGDQTEPERDKNGQTEGYGDHDDFDGPMKNRSCTDVICLLIFVAYLVGMMYLLGYALAVGDPYRLIYGYDVTGDVCGRENQPIPDVVNSSKNLESYKYLYFDIPKSVIILGQKGLGDEWEKAQTEAGYNFVDIGSTNNAIPFCLGLSEPLVNDTGSSSNNTTPPKEKLENEVAQNLLKFDPVSNALTGGNTCRYCVSECPNNYTSYFWRCVPEFAEESADKIYQGTGAKEFAKQIAADIQNSWKEILYMCLVALGLAFIMTILFRFLAAVIVYIIVISVAIACILTPPFMWFLWYTKQSHYDEHYNNKTDTTDSNFAQANEEGKKYLTKEMKEANSEEEVENYLSIAIVVTIAAVIILLVLLVLRKRIKLVVQLFKEAGKAVQSMPFILFQPLWTLLALFIVAVIWVYGLLWIESAGYPKENEHGFVTYEKDDFLFWMRVYNLFGFLWLAQFCIACQHMVIAGAISGWYFAMDKSKLHFPIAQSFWRLVRYHLGSVAFGSFIIALIQLIRIIMRQVEKKFRSRTGPAGQACGILFKVCQCCLWCFEKCMKFLNRNAYIEVAIYGYNFCRAAQKAFTLLTSNILRVAAINSVGTFVLFLGKVAVVVSTVFIGLEIMQTQQDHEKAKHVWAPVILAAIFAYAIIDCFIGVYGMAIDTIFLCFCEDSERNDGIEKPYYMSKGLMEFVENSSKALEAMKQRKYQASGKVEDSNTKKNSRPTSTMPMVD